MAARANPALAAVAALPLVIVSPAAAATAASAPGDVFRGTWTATDSDGSNLTLTILGAGAGGRHAIIELDDAARVCDGVPAAAAGSGVVDGDTMWVRWTVTCRPGGNPFRGPVEDALSHDGTSDTLIDSFGIVFQRTTG